MDRFDLPTARRRRDRGMGRVAGNNHFWLMDAVMIVDLFAPSGVFLAEVFRTFPHIGKPTHSNAWGPLTKALIRQNVIVPVGPFTKAASVKSNAHPYPLYRRADGRGSVF